MPAPSTLNNMRCLLYSLLHIFIHILKILKKKKTTKTCTTCLLKYTNKNERWLDHAYQFLGRTLNPIYEIYSFKMPSNLHKYSHIQATEYVTNNSGNSRYI